MSGYRLLTHAEVEDSPGFLEALCRLNALTFGEYYGVFFPTPDFINWYVTRPGLDLRLCQAAFLGEELVSSLFVTLARMRLGGEMVLCGFIDTVMTHPSHRRRGLASSLLRRALAGMKSAGAEVSLLYASYEDPPGPSQIMYEHLGYSLRQLVLRFVKQPPHTAEAAPAILIPPDDDTRRAFASALERHDGWIDLDDSLWRWRRIQRPSQCPTTLCKTASGALCAMCWGDLLATGRQRPVTVVSDLVLPDGNRGEDDLEAIIATAVGDSPITVFCADSDTSLRRCLRSLAFVPVATEAAMVRPLTPIGAELVRTQPGSWYAAVESIIGV